MNRIFSLLAGVAMISTAHAVTVGQIDTFQDGTTGNWMINLLGMGNPPPAALPSNIASGGPAGAGDAYLQLTSLAGNGGGSRLVALNPAQWGGNYVAAGINAISMDVNNLGTTELSLRLQFEDPTIGPPDNVAISQDAIVIPAQSGWQHVVFPISIADLTAIDGSVQTALENTTVVRIFHSAAGTVPGEALAAQLGIDNITALSGVPEGGSTVVLLAGGCASLLVLRRHRGEPSSRLASGLLGEF